MSALHVPEGLRFTCSQCGDCCRTWMVPLGPGEAERIGALEWREGTRPGNEFTAPMENARGRLRLARRSDGACVFLGARQQCLLHEHFGEGAKPLVCRLYPFAFVPMGNRTAVDVSFYCRAVSESRGEALEARVPEWTRLLEDHSPHAIEEGFALNEQKRATTELIWEYEFHLVQFIRNDSLPFHERLRCCTKFLDLTCTGDPLKESARLFRDAIAEGLPNQVRRQPLERDAMNHSQQALFFQELFHALNPLPHDLERKGQAEQTRRSAAAEKFREKKGPLWIDGREVAVSFEQVEAVSLEAFGDPSVMKLFENFFASRLVGQRFLFAGELILPLTEAMHRLLLVYPWCAWTARFLAAEAGLDSVGLEHVRRALRLLDRAIGQPMASPRPQFREVWLVVLLESHLVETALGELFGKAVD